MRAILLILVLSGCAGATQMHLPDGATGYNITCPGTANSWGNCFQKAGAICGNRGYDVVVGGSDQGFVATTTFAGSTHNRSMLIKCKQ